ncbi:hypothetical protein [Saccharopolyspora mangrovi]|uniref:Uncharacterized protein n=1 Tax=Saccharopolyspora mangrovi TaxID=3082379 RepID=A0ABU6A7A3_9PSEU|nr:hypothetical protein [Saccharopolyspora sp. S2-29]MEB3367386.1 hypothetical protein [Saccharopolyspora sp. S2-29]
MMFIPRNIAPPPDRFSPLGQLCEATGALNVKRNAVLAVLMRDQASLEELLGTLHLLLSAVREDWRHVHELRKAHADEHQPQGALERAALEMAQLLLDFIEREKGTREQGRQEDDDG